jgi:hypothetical protein
MTQRTRATLKTYFETGDKPTQTQFEDFIDSIPNFANGDSSLWTKKTVLYTDLTGLGGSSAYLAGETLVAKQICHEIIVHTKTAFTGGTISAAACSAYQGSGTHPVSNALNIFAAGGDASTLRAYMGGAYAGDFVNSWDLKWYFSVTGDTLNHLTAGEIDIYYRTVKIY